MRWQLLFLGVLALTTLVLLAAGLRGTTFRGGKPWPAGPSFSYQPGGEALAFPLDWLPLLLRFLFLVGAAGLVLSLFFRTLRRQLVRFLVAMGLIFLTWQILTSLPKNEVKEPPSPPSAELGRGSPGESSQPTQEIRAPPWAIYVGALVAGTLLAVWLAPKLASRLWQVQRARAIEEVAREARLELVQGAPVQDVVLRAWLRMVEILSRRSGAKDQPQLTPREFAQTLARLGFRDEAISLLTQLFEEVRYGHKDSESRRELALAALSALEKAYG